MDSSTKMVWRVRIAVIVLVFGYIGGDVILRRCQNVAESDTETFSLLLRCFQRHQEKKVAEVWLKCERINHCPWFIKCSIYTKFTDFPPFVAYEIMKTTGKQVTSAVDNIKRKSIQKQDIVRQHAMFSNTNVPLRQTTLQDGLTMSKKPRKAGNQKLLKTSREKQIPTFALSSKRPYPYLRVTTGPIVPSISTSSAVNVRDSLPKNLASQLQSLKRGRSRNHKASNGTANDRRSRCFVPQFFVHRPILIAYYVRNKTLSLFFLRDRDKKMSTETRVQLTSNKPISNVQVCVKCCAMYYIENGNSIMQIKLVKTAIVRILVRRNSKIMFLKAERQFFSALIYIKCKTENCYYLRVFKRTNRTYKLYSRVNVKHAVVNFVSDFNSSRIYGCVPDQEHVFIYDYRTETHDVFRFDITSLYPKTSMYFVPLKMAVVLCNEIKRTFSYIPKSSCKRCRSPRSWKRCVQPVAYHQHLYISMDLGVQQITGRKNNIISIGLHRKHLQASPLVLTAS